LAAIEHAEAERGEPPYMTDVYRSLAIVSRMPRLNFTIMAFTVNDIYRNDECLADREQGRLSLNKDLQ